MNAEGASLSTEGACGYNVLAVLDAAGTEVDLIPPGSTHVSSMCSRDLLSLGLFAKQGYTLHLTYDNPYMISPVGLKIPLAFETDTNMLIFPQITQPRIDSVFHTAEKRKILTQVTYFMHVLQSHSMNFQAIRKTIENSTAITFNNVTIKPEHILSSCNCSACKTVKVNKTPLRRTGRPNTAFITDSVLLADNGPIDSLSNKPPPTLIDNSDLLDLSDTSFDDEFTADLVGEELMMLILITRNLPF